MTEQKALEVLKSWLQLAYHNPDGTDEDSAELYEALQTVFALITRQQSKIDKLKTELKAMRGAANSLKMHYEEAQAKIESLKQRNTVCEAANRCIVWQRDRRDREIEELHSQIAGLNIYKSKIKAEAYKECLAKVKNYIKTHCNPYGKPDFDYDTSIKILNFIDNLAKEIIGE